MKKTRSIFLGIVSFSVVLVVATGCFRPAAPDVTPTSSGDAEAATPGGSDIEATAIANSTRAAQTLEAQTAEAEAPGEEEEEPTEATPAPAATATLTGDTSTEEPGAATPAGATTVPTVPPTTVLETPAPTTAPATTAAPSAATTYVVQPGDTLYSIAVAYGTTVGAITQASGIANASQIYVGQTLTIPGGSEPISEPSQPAAGGTTYVVQPGDRLFRIALRYNMSWTQLAQYNGITDPNSIYPGQVLQIPPQ